MTKRPAPVAGLDSSFNMESLVETEIEYTDYSAVFDIIDVPTAATATEPAATNGTTTNAAPESSAASNDFGQMPQQVTVDRSKLETVYSKIHGMKTAIEALTAELSDVERMLTRFIERRPTSSSAAAVAASGPIAPASRSPSPPPFERFSSDDDDITHAVEREPSEHRRRSFNRRKVYKCKAHLPLATYEDLLAFENTLDVDDLCTYLRDYCSAKSLGRMVSQYVQAVYSVELCSAMTWSGVRDLTDGWLKLPMKTTRLPTILIDLLHKTWPQSRHSDCERSFRVCVAHAMDRKRKLEQDISLGLAKPTTDVAAVVQIDDSSSAAQPPQRPQTSSARSRSPMEFKWCSSDDDNSGCSSAGRRSRTPTNRRRRRRGRLHRRKVYKCSAHLPLHTYEELLAFEDTLDEEDLCAYLQYYCSGNTLGRMASQFVQAVYSAVLCSSMTWCGVRIESKEWIKPPLKTTRMPAILIDLLHSMWPQSKRTDCEKSVRMCILHGLDRKRKLLKDLGLSALADPKTGATVDSSMILRTAQLKRIRLAPVAHSASDDDDDSGSSSAGRRSRTPTHRRRRRHGRRSHRRKVYKCKAHLPLATYADLLAFEADKLDKDDLCAYLLDYCSGNTPWKLVLQFIQAVYSLELCSAMTWCGVRDRSGGWLKPPMKITQMPTILIDLLHSTFPHTKRFECEQSFRSCVLHALDRKRKHQQDLVLLGLAEPTTGAAAVAVGRTPSSSMLVPTDDGSAAQQPTQRPPRSPSPPALERSDNDNNAHVEYNRRLPLATYADLLDFEESMDEVGFQEWLESRLDALGDAPELNAAIAEAVRFVYAPELLLTMTWRGVRRQNDDDVGGGHRVWPKQSLDATSIPYIIMAVCQERCRPSNTPMEQVKAAFVRYIDALPPPLPTAAFDAQRYAQQLPLHTYDALLAFEEAADEAELTQYLQQAAACGRDVDDAMASAAAAVYTDELLAATSWSGERAPATAAGAPAVWQRPPLRVTTLPYLLAEVCRRRFAATTTREECQRAFQRYAVEALDRLLMHQLIADNEVEVAWEQS